MKTSTWSILTAGLLSAALWAESQQAREMPKPGKHHDFLKQFEGTWDATSRFMTEPGKPMTESKGVETASVGFGGFWLTYDFKGEMTGAPFNGRGEMGYDLKKQKYVGTWIDSMQSGIFISEGTCDEHGKVFTLIAQGFCDEQGKSITMKQVMEIKDKDTRLLTFLTPNPDGKEMVMGTIEYTRRK